MGDLLIRNISDALKADITLQAERSGRSLSDEAKALLQQGLTVKNSARCEGSSSAWDQLRPIFANGDRQPAEEFARLMNEVEADRKANVGRPVEALE